MEARGIESGGGHQEHRGHQQYIIIIVQGHGKLLEQFNFVINLAPEDCGSVAGSAASVGCET